MVQFLYNIKLKRGMTNPWLCDGDEEGEAGPAALPLYEGDKMIAGSSCVGVVCSPNMSLDGASS